jgi:hypothetical protein
MARYNPELMMVDGGGDTVFTPSAPKVDARIALRKLQSGQALTDDEKRELGLPVTAPTVTAPTVTDTTIVENKPQWTKVSTVITANGPVDVDANGVAVDGSVPVAVVANTDTSGVPAGFTAGPFPRELEQFFGSSAGILGYRIINNPDGSQQLEVADGPGSAKTFGFKFGVDNTGKYVKFNTSSSGSGNVLGSGLKTADQIALDTKAAEDKAKRKSAYDMLYEEFDRYGLGSLVSDIKNILVDGSLDPTEFSLKIRNTDAYKARFVANEARLAKGLRALSPADYISLEDKYQEVMRQYGLPESYYAKTGTGVQEGFRKLIENDVSNLELEDRISTAQKRVMNANPEVTQALRQFYPDINNADILAYTLDPKNAIENIKRKVTNAEIGGAALQAGLQTNLSRAEQLQKAGIDQAAAEKGFGTIAGGLQRGSQLASIYGEDPYTQDVAETEVFNIAGAQDARKQRQKITGLEKATFSGQSGISSGALARDRAGAY